VLQELDVARASLFPLVSILFESKELGAPRIKWINWRYILKRVASSSSFVITASSWVRFTTGSKCTSADSTTVSFSVVAAATGGSFATSDMVVLKGLN
jgi:hypothetical protein